MSQDLLKNFKEKDSHLDITLTTSPNLNKVLKKLRSKVSFLKEDRILNQDLQNASKLIRNGELIKAIGIDIFPTLGSI